MKMNWKPDLRVLIALLVILIVALFLLFKAGLFSTSEVLYIAVVGPTNKPDGEEMVRGIRMYLDQIDYEVNGKTVKLLEFDDEDNMDLARERALEIAKSNALVVLGHHFSSTSRAGGEVYQEFGLPAISGSATANDVTEGNDWYFRVIFTNRSQANFLAIYVHEVLKQKTVSIIYDQDNYGTSLVEAFESKFQSLGGEINGKWDFNSQENENLDQALEGIIGELSRVETDGPGMVFLATHGSEAEKLIVLMKRNNLPYGIIGADAIGDPSFAEQFEEYSEEQDQPGFFLEGIYAVSPIIFDAANEEAQQFRNDFLELYGVEPGWTAATYYEAALVAIRTIEMAEVQGKQENLAEERQKIRDHLAQLGPADDIEGLTGPIYFDEYGDVDKVDLGQGLNREADKLVDIGIYKDGRFVSAWTQLQYLTDAYRWADFLQERQVGRIIIDNGSPIYKTNIVYTGVDINQVSNLDAKSSTYTIDFYLWFRYQSQFEDVVESDVEFINSVEKVELGEPIADEVVNGVTYRAYRIIADFKSDFDFEDYPFDEQTLAIKFRHTNLTREKLIYAVDEVGMRQTKSEAILEKFERANVFGSITNWEPIEAHFSQDIMYNESTMGNPRFTGSDAGIEYSRFNAVIHIKRDPFIFSIKNLFPMFVVIGVAYLVFFLPPTQLSSAYGIVTGALLTVAFFHLKLSSDLPGVGYIVALDYVFYSIYVLITIELILTIINHRQYSKENEALVERINRISRVVYPVVILIGIALFLYRYEIITLPF